VGHKRPEIESAVERFRCGLLASLGPAPTAAEVGLTDAAATLYLAVLLCQRKLQSGRDRQGNLLDQLPLLSGSLNRTLRSLQRRQTNATTAGDTETPIEWLARRTAEKNAGK
jgi:hypothetical protein